MSVPSQSICALETTGHRKFLFFVDRNNHIVYYERQPQVAANFIRPSPGFITDRNGKKIRTASNFISGITYNAGSQVRIYYVGEDPDDEGAYVLGESYCTMDSSTASTPTWNTGELNGNSISVKQNSLLTAMSQPDGFPMVIYENPAKHTMWSAFMTLDQSTGEENWTHKKLNLSPDPNDQD